MKNNLKLTALAIFTHLVFQQIAYASVVRDDVDYQYFRDFAENKGKFTFGASNIPIYDKSNNPIGVMLKNVPMIDLGSVSRSGVANLIHPQYIASVWHNTGYESVSFGEAGNNPDAHHFEYVLVDRNDYPKGQGLSEDYHIPRLHKLVTEVSPSAVTSAGEEIATYKNTTRFPMFVRAGSGTQYTREKGKQIHQVSSAYRYLTGGVPVAVGGRRNHWVDARGWIFGNDHGPLVTYATGGDSGSPLFAYDTQENQWVMVGVLNSNNGDGGNANTFAINRVGYISQKQEEDVGARIEVTTRGENFAWTLDKTSNNSSTLTSDLRSIHVDIFDPNAATAAKHKPRLNHGKNLYFSGETGSLNLVGDINQGAGALYFDNDFTVTGNNEDTTWQGAGISVSENKQVTWKLHNPENDRLSKIGKGTLYVSGKGKNKGDISVGEGTVILDQQANENGEKQAFNQVGIVSGRSTVVLNDAQQVDPDKIYFGFRGGRLDLNGNDLTFKYIQNTDDGAKIVNHNLTQTANVTITNPRLLTRNELRVNDRVHANQHFYSWDKADNNPNTYDYFLPKKGTSKPYYPTNQQSNDDWEYIGSDLEKAKDIVLERLNKEKLVYAFNGYFGETDKTKNNGNLNLTFSPETDKHLFFVTGGLELNGDVNVTKGNLLLSGRPTPHAYDHLQGKDVIIDDDWINRSFNATNINVQDGNFYIGRNVATANANFSAQNQANLYLGFIQNKTPVCIRSDYSGKVLSCKAEALSESVYQSLPTTKILGNVHLTDNGKLNLGKAKLKGQITASQNTEVQLYKDAHWIMADSNTIDNLILNEGSRISLNSDKNNNTNILTINKSLSGNGLFHFATYISNQLGNKILVKGTALGHYQFDVQDQGTEPDKSKRLTLLRVENGNLDNQLNVSLYNKAHVDLGTYRYHLMKDDHEIYLHSPAQAEYDAEIARIAEEKHQKEAEAARIAEEKRRKEEEEARLAEEKRQQEEEAARIAAEERKLLVAKNTQADLISASANAAVSEFSSQINALLHINSYLDRKLTEKQSKEWYFWSRVENQKMHNHSDLYRSYQQNINLQQIGIEKQFSNDIAFGALYSLGLTKDLYADNIVGKRKIHQLSMYLKKYWIDNFFSSIDIGYAKSNNQINANGEQNQFSRNIWSFGTNLGYGFNVANVKIQPHLGLRYYQISSADYAINELNAKANENVLAYHAGISISKVFQHNELSIRPEFTSYYVDANHKSANIESNDIQLSSEFNRQLRNDLNVNLQYQNMNLNLGFGLGYGSNVDKQRLLNLQFGYTW